MFYIERAIVYACVKLMHSASRQEKQNFDKFDIDRILERHDIHPRDKIKDIILKHNDEIQNFIFKTHGIFNPNKQDEIYTFSTGMFKLLDKYDL